LATNCDGLSPLGGGAAGLTILAEESSSLIRWVFPLFSSLEMLLRFKPYPRWEYRESDRVRQNYARRCARQVDAAGLFAEEAKAAQLPVEAEMERRRELTTMDEARWRSFQADCWIRGRREYFALTDELRAEFKRYWDLWTGPATGVYFSTALLAFRRRHGLAPIPDLSHMQPQSRHETTIQPALSF